VDSGRYDFNMVNYKLLKKKDRDQEEHFCVLGRTADIINVSGRRVSTMEIESAVISAKGVVEITVIGVLDHIKGITPITFVTLQRGIELNENLEKSIKD